MRCPVWVPQTMQKAESDVEQLATQASCKLGLSTWALWSNCPLPPTSGATQLGQKGRRLGQGVRPYSTCQFHRKQILNRNCCQPTTPFWFAIQYTFFYQILICHATLMLQSCRSQPIFPWENTLFSPLEASILCAELSYFKSTIIPLRNNN